MGNMDEEIKKRFDQQDELLRDIYRSAEKTRKYFKGTLIISIIVILLPLIGLVFVIPQFLNIYTSSFEGLL